MTHQSDPAAEDARAAEDIGDPDPAGSVTSGKVADWLKTREELEREADRRWGNTVDELEATVAQQAEEVAELRRELREQWESAHADHCDWWPHLSEHECHWPMPDVLRVPPGAASGGAEG